MHLDLPQTAVIRKNNEKSHRVSLRQDCIDLHHCLCVSVAVLIVCSSPCPSKTGTVNGVNICQVLMDTRLSLTITSMTRKQTGHCFQSNLYNCFKDSCKTCVRWVTAYCWFNVRESIPVYIHIYVFIHSFSFTDDDHKNTNGPVAGKQKRSGVVMKQLRIKIKKEIYSRKVTFFCLYLRL